LNLRKQIRAISVLIWFDGVLPIRRSPFSLVNFIVSPLTILFFIYIFAGPGKVDLALGGGLIAVIVGSCIVLETEAAFMRLVVKLQDMFVSSPISPATYVAGLSIGQLCNGIAGMALFSLLLALYVHLTVIGGLEIAAAAVITWASISALGFMISTFARDIRDLWVYSPLLNVVLAFLPPVFYPISYIPSSIRFVAYLAPTTYPAQVIQQAIGIAGSGQNLIPQDIVGGVLYTLLLVTAAAKLGRWRQS
jgi:ABC-2 type transport system permease protein